MFFPVAQFGKWFNYYHLHSVILKVRLTVLPIPQDYCEADIIYVLEQLVCRRIFFISP